MLSVGVLRSVRKATAAPSCIFLGEAGIRHIFHLFAFARQLLGTTASCHAILDFYRMYVKVKVCPAGKIQRSLNFVWDWEWGLGVGRRNRRAKQKKPPTVRPLEQRQRDTITMMMRVTTTLCWSRFLLLIVALFQPLNVAFADEATAEESSHSNSNASPLPPAVIVSLSVPLPMVPDRKPDECATWASQGECDTNPGFMHEDCATSCGVTREAVVHVLDGEDAAMGAVRFAEEQNLLGNDDNDTNDNAQSSSTVLLLATAQALHAKLQSDVPTYEIPKEFSHCGGKRPCSAGKLWKRAEEMRKADMHDVAGADYIRALMKTGIEVDFVERCHQSLRWALGSIRRQRERERREALEEEKLEQRRQEELAAMEEARLRREEYEADFVKFGAKVQESLNSDDGSSKSASASIGADGTVEEEEETSQEVLQLLQQVKQTYVQEGAPGNHSEVIQLLKRIPPGDKTIDVLLIEARCHELLGNHKSALSAAGKLVQKAANHDPWINDSPRMMAAMLGANAAMAMGLSTNALSFYQTVLKFDPEQERARKQYRGLKKVVKLLDKAEEQVSKHCDSRRVFHLTD